jgi:hypothetical protein
MPKHEVIESRLTEMQSIQDRYSCQHSAHGSPETLASWRQRQEDVTRLVSAYQLRSQEYNRLLTQIKSTFPKLRRPADVDIALPDVFELEPHFMDLAPSRLASPVNYATSVPPSRALGRSTLDRFR